MNSVISHIRSRHAQELRARVASRRTDYDSGWYCGDTVEEAGALVADFKEVFESDIKHQSLERFVVSMACITSMVMKVASGMVTRIPDLRDAKPSRCKAAK